MRLLAKFTLSPTTTTNRPTSVKILKQPHLPDARLWFSVSLDDPHNVKASLTRGNNPPIPVARNPVATLASSLDGRPAFVDVKPQVQKKRKRDSGVAVASVSVSASVSASPAPVAAKDAPVAASVSASPAPATSIEQEHRAPKRLRLSASSLLLTPRPQHPAGATFSPGQALWARSMLSAIQDGRILADAEGVNCWWLVEALKWGANQVEMEGVVEVGMDGFAKGEEVMSVEGLLGKVMVEEMEEDLEEELVESVESVESDEEVVESDKEVVESDKEVVESDKEVMGSVESDEESTVKTESDEEW